MPTKSGRIKLADLRQGKTFWMPGNSELDKNYVPEAHFVIQGPRQRVVGIREVDGAMQVVTMPMLATTLLSFHNSITIWAFHPDSPENILSSPDGSFYHASAFTTRRRCQRACDALNRERFYRYLENIKYAPYARYDGNYVAPVAAWEGTPPAVPGDVDGRS
ncbi:hypothetical protein [Burkholderia phage FLC9]|nr:hypothetical protein [Burkholderia phage FLC9]